MPVGGIVFEHTALGAQGNVLHATFASMFSILRLLAGRRRDSCGSFLWE
jgi:hypothetical protein